MPLSNNSTLKTVIDGFENLKNAVNNNRISLRNKLENKNIDVSENEKLSSLINKVDDLKAIDIISATELPPAGKENQICVITDNPLDKYALTFNSADLTSENMISLCYDDPLKGGTLYSITSGSLTSKYYFTRALQGADRKTSYYYSSGSWHILTRGGFDIMKQGTYTDPVNIARFNMHMYSQVCSYTDGKGLSVGSYNTYDWTSLNKSIDFSQYSTLTFTAYATTSLARVWVSCFKSSETNWSGTLPTAGTASSNILHHRASRLTIAQNTPTVYTVDISSWTNTGYLGFIKGETSQKFYITDISLA